MFETLTAHLGGLQGPLTALLQVLMIDLVLAGDNAVAVGLAAGGLPPKDRKKVILYGLGAAVVLRISFALITTWLLGVIGLLLAGGFLLLWVCWKMWRELREQAANADAMASIALDDDQHRCRRHPGRPAQVVQGQPIMAGHADRRRLDVAGQCVGRGRRGARTSRAS
jgi:predicted tellurium resistance membrane protein TerC